MQASAQTKELVALFCSALESEQEWQNVWRLARLTSKLLGDRLEAGDASQYIYHYARRQGYDLPPFPLAGCGEIKQFFFDEGVEDIPQWYERLGIVGEEYQRLHEKTIVAARRMDGKRLVLLLDGVLYNNAGLFESLEKSGFIQKAKPDVTAHVLKQVLLFIAEEGVNK